MLIRRSQLALAVALLLSAGLLGGCERDPVIDATDDQTIEASIDTIAEQMSDEDAQTFRDAIQVLVMYETAEALEDDADLTAEQRTEQRNERLRERLHNQTASDVIDQVMELREQRLDDGDDGEAG